MPAAEVEPCRRRVNCSEHTVAEELTVVPAFGAPAQGAKSVIKILSIPISVVPKSPVARNLITDVADVALNWIVFCSPYTGTGN